MTSELTSKFVSTWFEILQKAGTQNGYDPRNMWTKDLGKQRALATQLNFRACLNFCGGAIADGNDLTLSLSCCEGDVLAHAEQICSQKGWTQNQGEFLRLDLSVHRAVKPHLLEFAAELENNSISLERDRPLDVFLHSDTFGLSDFVKLLLVPSRVRVYVGRTMRYGKTTSAYAKEIQKMFAEFVEQAIACGRSVHADDHIIVLLIFMQERRASWPNDCVFQVGIGERVPGGASLTWEEYAFPP